MSEKIAKQPSREWLESECSELENKIQQLTSELDRAKKEYESFKIVLGRLQNYSSYDTDQAGTPPIEPIRPNFEKDFEDRNVVPTLEVTESDDFEDENEEAPPQKWLRSEYQTLSMEDAVLDVLKQCQPARPGDIALRMYNIREDDQNFRRIRNSVNSTLSIGKQNNKWKVLRRGVYALNSYPDSLTDTVS